MAPSYRRLQQLAIAISILSVIYNGAEAGVSIGLGSEASSRSLVFFGVQSGIEVISACIVVWRFKKVAKPGDEKRVELGPKELRVEKIATASIGTLLFILALGTEVTAIAALALHQEPDSSNASLIVSASAFVLMVLIWLPKRYLARALDSSAMKGEATCSLSCIQITIVLFVGSLIHRLWKGGWWVDSATSLFLGLLFAWEGYKMIDWVRSPDFNGGCCETCKTDHKGEELGERYRDLCNCCLMKDECKNAEECKCGDNIDQERGCCQPIDENGSKCCTHKTIQGTCPSTPRADAPQQGDSCLSDNEAGSCKDGCCAARDP